VWTAWLAFAAVLPDVDYPMLWIWDIHPGIRYTHSIAFGTMVCIATLAVLRALGAGDLRLKAVQILAASFSHLVLDSLVGVHPNPWFWPLSAHVFRLPWGVLPSAGKLDFSNGHLYINAFLELCILSPLFWIPWILFRKKGREAFRYSVAAAIVWFPFLVWSLNLKR
jgi:membrane-bound metal-dependent hydrolase YbcI (DUF457 family)